MEPLEIKHNTSAIIRKILSVIMLLNGISWILGHLDSLKFYHLLFGIVFIVLGIAYFTDMFDTENTYIYPGEDHIKLKWMNWFRTVVIKDEELEKIILKRYKVIIQRKSKKPLNLTLDFYEREQKKQVYDYFIEYARRKSWELEKDF